MKILTVIAVLGLYWHLAAPAARGQDAPAPGAEMSDGTWQFSAITGGGSGLGKSSNTQFFLAGGRAGRVLTGEHLGGWLKGDFEWAVDVMPVYVVFAGSSATVPTSKTVYGASFKPVIWEWNFTSHEKVVPYAAIEGGILFSTSDVPRGNTSQVNFTPQGAVGAHVFVKPDRALLLEAAIVHHSSASLGRQNPGYNASFFFTVGYSWFKSRR